MSYKILVLDLDGTLTNSEKIITPETKKVLFQIQEAGIKVVLASGRPTYGIIPLANELKLNQYGGYVLSFNGAKIINCANNEVIYQRTIPGEMIPLLDELAKKYHVDMLTYENEDIILENTQNEYAIKESVINKMPIVQIGSFASYVDFPINKAIMLGDGDYLAQVEPKVKEETHGILEVYRSEPFFLELMPKNIDKAYSLGKLLEHLELTPEDMMACGDGYNDLSMIKYAGMGVAMANAQESVKEAANYITCSNDEDGVARAIEKFILGVIE